MRNAVKICIIFTLLLLVPLASAGGEYIFDFAAKVGNDSNYIKHWSDTYPPDPKADIIVFAAAFNTSYRRLSALGFLYVVSDPYDNIVAVEKISSFKRSYDPNVVYYTFHPKADWIEGNYKVKILIYDMIDHEAFDERIAKDPFAIGIDPEKYKIFYDTGANAKDLGVVRDLGDPVAQAVLNFKIDKKVTIYPPDRFLLHDVRFIDDSTDRITGEKLTIEVKVDNNYKDDGEIKLAMLVDNNLVATNDVTVKGLSTSTVTFDAKAAKPGSYKLHFGADTPDLKYRNAELTFTIKNETESTKLEIPKIKITGLNVNKEFAGKDEVVTVSVTAINNGKTGNKTITVYSNRVPVGSDELRLQYLEEKTVEIPVNLKTMGINKITVSDAPQLYRNVFIQESGASTNEQNSLFNRIKENTLKISMMVVFLLFAGMLYYVRNKLKEESLTDVHPQEIINKRAENRRSNLKDKLTGRMNELTGKMKNIVKKKTR